MDILKLRQDVFIIEQNCIYEDIDGLDPICTHFTASAADAADAAGSEILAAYCRVIPPGIKHRHAALGRIIVREDFRGRHIGREIIREAILFISRYHPGHGIWIEAQSHLEAYYARFGFERTSEDFILDGIPHVEMVIEASKV